MIVLIKPQLATLIARGQLEVWSPRVNPPALGHVHEVRSTGGGGPLTWARKALCRDAVLQDLTFEEAMAAGFKTRQEFWGWWRKRFGTGPLLEEPVLALVVVFVLVAEEPIRYLHRRSEFGYTTSAHSGLEGEHAVPAAAQRQYTEEAAGRGEERHRQRREAWERLTIRERLAELEMMREFARADVSRELRLVDHALRRAWEKLERARAA